MGLTHASITPGESVHASRPEGHSVKRSYVPIKPAFRPLLPKPATRDASPSTGIQIHTRATLNAGRKRLVTSKPVDLQKRRRPSPTQSPAASPVSTASPKLTSPVSTAKSNLKNSKPSSPNVSVAPTSPPIAAAKSIETNSNSLPIDIAKPSPNWVNDAFVSPPTPASLGESSPSINMASLVNSSANSTIDPVYMVMDNEFDQFSGMSLAPASSMSSVDEQWTMADLAPVNDGTSLLLSPNFTNNFDDLSDFYFREPIGGMPPQDSVSDGVSNFMPTQLEASLSTDEKMNNEMAIMDYFVPANELF